MSLNDPELQPEEEKNWFERVPGPVKLLIIDTAAAAALIALGLPPGWAVTAVGLGDLTALLIRRNQPDKES